MKRLISLVFVLLLLLPNLASGLALAPEETTEPTEPISSAVQSEPAESAETASETSDTAAPTETACLDERSEPAALKAARSDENHTPYISGMPDGCFYPNKKISRASLAVILYRLGSYEPGPERFSDVTGDKWYVEAVNALANAGVLGGFPDGSFRPNNTATRAQLASILAALSGETAAGTASFSDVSPTHWAGNAIALAQEKGWVTGYPDGSFRPEQGVTRAEAVAVINRFLGRVPDRNTISQGDRLRFFPDVQEGRWYYEAVMEAATTHTAHWESEDAAEQWLNPTPGSAPWIHHGFYCIDGNLFVAVNGAYVHTVETGLMNNIRYTCTGSSGICTARAEVLALADENLILLSGGKPIAAPGSYEDGIYLKGGHLFVAENGLLLHTACSGSCDGVSYTCTGANGRCTVPDWTQLNLSGIDLSVFSNTLTPAASASGSENASIADALRAAVEVYEAYFRVEYPVSSDQTEDYVAKALEYGILSRSLSSYDEPVSRGDVAAYLWRALRGRSLEPINDISEIPDVSEGHSRRFYLLALYRAGVMTGSGTMHNACSSGTLTVTELAELLRRLERPSERVRFTIPVKVVKTVQYGTSGSGKYPLTAYKLGSGKNVMVLSFAIHGWEDNWDRDGAALVYLADQVKAWLEQNYDLLVDGDWTVYILRCMNPDGLNLGTTCNGPGRCTTTSYDANGTLIYNRGVDMNRCFPYEFRLYTGDRNYNGAAPLACVEALAASNYVSQIKGSGHNSQILTTSGTGTVYSAFHTQFPDNSYKALTAGYGYFSAWAGYVKGYDSCLLELPQSITSYDLFLSSGCVAKYETAIRFLLRHYNGPTSVKSTCAEAEEIELDGN